MVFWAFAGWAICMTVMITVRYVIDKIKGRY